MGRRRLLLGITLGAVAGGAAAMLDRETRDYARDKFDVVRAQTSYLISNPSEAVQNMKATFDNVSNSFAAGAENAVKALEQVETTLERVTNKKQ